MVIDDEHFGDRARADNTFPDIKEHKNVNVNAARSGKESITTILNVLPHRFPFLLLDRLIYVTDTEIMAVKNVTINEPVLAGHFPDHPIMPGVLIIEALAQAAMFMTELNSGRAGEFAYLTSVDKARFKQPVVPGDQLYLHVKKLGAKMGAWMMYGEALVEGFVVAKMQFSGVTVRRDGSIPLSIWWKNRDTTKNKDCNKEGGDCDKTKAE